ncbi:MAG: alkaline phosphatase D family protein [Bacteroidota bacterium]
MKTYTFLILSFALLLCTSCEESDANKGDEQGQTVIRLGFGSCASQDKPQPMLDIAADKKLDAFIYLGDNIYGDSRVMDTLKAKYARLAAKESFQHLKASTQLFATWDDHDYGENDAGRHYPFKAASKEIFMDFWEVPSHSERRKHEGIYGEERIKKGALDVQIILLDTRTFRDHLLHREKSDTTRGFKNDYIVNTGTDSTMLGETQWTWLKETLKKPADVRIVASSNQFSHEYNGWESWTNVPSEQKKFIELIKETKANGVVFISGDVHWGEISKMPVDDGYPLYDVTSSGITQTWDIIEPNKNRMGEAIPQNNVGLIEITKSSDGVQLQLALIDSSASAVQTHDLKLPEISFEK